jgi:nitric oxide reductase large subunit
MSERSERAGRGRELALLWIALGAGPLAWLIDLETSYALAWWVCGRPLRPVLAAVTAGALALVAIGLGAAWLGWRTARRHAEGRPATRVRFLVAIGFGLSLLSLGLVLGGAVPKLFLGGCE